MAWDGSGSFTRTNGTQTGATTWANARDAGNNITASQHDTHDQDLADGIGACLTKNNETKPTADFRPNADAIYDLGSSSLQWTELYLSSFIRGLTDLRDNSGNEWIKFTKTSSAVNEVTITNAATGNAVNFAASGGDTDVSLVIASKGAGFILIDDDDFALRDNGDATKKLQFQLSGITTGNTRTLTAPDASGALALTSDIPSAATQAEQETGSSTSAYVTPGRQQYHPSAAKGWSFSDYSGNTAASYNVSSTTDSGTGHMVVNWNVDMSSASYAAVASGKFTPGGNSATTLVTMVASTNYAAGTTQIFTILMSTFQSADGDNISCAVFGDQA